VGRQIGLRQAVATIAPEQVLDTIRRIQAGHDMAGQTRTVICLVQILAKQRLAVYLALVAQAVFGLGAGQFEAGLAATIDGGTGAGPDIAVEIKCKCRIGGQSQAYSDQQGEGFESDWHEIRTRDNVEGLLNLQLGQAVEALVWSILTECDLWDSVSVQNPGIARQSLGSFPCINHDAIN